MSSTRAPQTETDEIARQASERRRGVLAELASMFWRHKKWWLAPIVILLVLVGALVVLGGGPLGPFLYPLF